MKATQIMANATVIVSNGVKRLISYETEVAKIDKSGNIKVNGWYSVTTAKHINAFLELNGYDRLSKKDMMGGCTL